jgi:PAS domain S-box-containing protein
MIGLHSRSGIGRILPKGPVADQTSQATTDADAADSPPPTERADFERLISTLATDLISQPFDRIEAHVADALRAIGSFTGVDRSFLYCADVKHTAYELKAEFAARPLAPIGDTETFRRLPVETMPQQMMDPLRANQVVSFPNTRYLFQVPPLQAMLDARPGRGVLLLPITHGNHLAGILGLSSAKRETVWPIWQIDLMRILSQGLLRALERASAEAERERLLNQERRARAEADMARELLLGMVKRAPDPFVAIDPEGNVLVANDTTLAAWGKTSAQVIGVHWTKIARPEVVPAITEAIAHAQREQRQHSIDIYLPATHRWWTMTFFPSSRGTSVLFIDITQRKRAEQARDYLADEIRQSSDPDGIVGAGMAPVLEKVLMVAGSDATVLITGETGTGKELVARAIHQASRRSDRMLVKVNCAAVSAGLVESELFGHEKGAFTGAVAKRMGRFEVADGGTLFLDEVGELPLETQAKLLRVLQERELERVGSSLPIKVDVRVVAATNRDLETEVKEGRFRHDLLFRLNVFPIAVPPLRERRGDIPDLCEVFVRQESRKLGKGRLTLSADALAWLSAADWPGNVREVQNVIARSCIVAKGAEVSLSDLLAFSQPQATAAQAPSPTHSLAQLQHEATLRALEASRWVVDGAHGAAKKLGLHPNTLRSRMKKLKISKPANV